MNKSAHPDSSLQLLRSLTTKVDFKASSLLQPVVLVFLGAIFEGISLYLLVPAVQGSIKMEFAFIKSYGVLGSVFSRLPDGIASRTDYLFLILVGLILVSASGKIFFSYAGALRCACLGRRFADQMRRVLFERCLRFGKLYFDQENTGHIQHVLLDSTEAIITQLLTMQNMLTYFFLLVVYLAVMIDLSWRLSIGVIVVFPVAHYLVGWLISKIKSASLRHAEARKALSGYVAGVFSNIILVKSSASESSEKRRFGELSDKVRELAFLMNEKSGLVIPIQEAFFLMMLLIMLSVLVFLGGGQNASVVPRLLVYMYLLRKSSTAVTVLSKYNASLAAIHGPLSDVLSLFKDHDKALITDGKKTFLGLKNRIELNNLSYAFQNEVKVLHGITFSIEKGKMTALVGPSGAGKTTLVNLMMRFYDPPQGAILIDGVDIRELTLESLRKRIAFISQDTLLFNDTIRSNVSYASSGHIPDGALLDVLKKARLYDCVMKLPQGLDTKIGDHGVKLSGGEKQRLSIARAIAKDAEFLILDEATSSLDSGTEALIQDSINEVLIGRTSVVIAHRLSTITTADKIVVLEDGRVVEQGSRVGLLKKRGHFHRYCETQKFG